MDIATIVSNINTLVAEAVAAASAPLQASINSLNILIQNKNALLATRDATIVQLTADFDAYKLSHPDTTTGDNVAPSIPASLTATAVPTSQINLTWTASTDNVGVTGYNVFRNNVQVATPTGTSYTDTGLTAGTTYSYTVKAHDAAGNLSANSVSVSATTTGGSTGDTTAPSVPTGLAATVVSGTQVNLAWNASTDAVGVTGYNVFRNGVQVGTPTGRTYSDTGLTASTAYTYTVKAHDAAGNLSANSTVVSATTSGTVTPPNTFPDATNTGAKGTLTAYTGPMTITGSGVTIENKTINGTLRVTGANFVMKNCKLTFSDWWGIDAEGASNPSIQDCTFVGPGSGGDSNSALLISGTVLRCNISQCENGITLTNGASTVKGNFIHDLFDKSTDPHYDCISVQGGQNGVLIEGNTLIGKDTSHVIICDDFGNVDNVTVNANYMGGNPGYSMYSVARHSSDKGWHVSGVKLTNNKIVKPGNGKYDASGNGINFFSIENSQTTISGNVDAATGKPIIG